MTAEKSPLRYVIDLDGPVFNANQKAADIYCDRVAPYVEKGEGHTRNALTRAINRAQTFFHEKQRVNGDLLECLHGLANVSDLHDRQKTIHVVSAREERFLSLTRSRLLEAGVLPFIDHIGLLGVKKNLNTIVDYVERMLSQGSHVVMLEDKGSLALSVADCFPVEDPSEPQFLAYVPENPISLQLLRTGLCPQNFTVIKNLTEIPRDIDLRIRTGSL